MIEWINDCPEDYEKFLFEVYNLADCQIDKISLLYDIICSWDLREVISEFQKWQEQKKDKLTVDKSLDFIETQVENCKKGLIDYEDMVKKIDEHIQESD